MSIQFESLEEYLDAFAKDRALAIMPVPVVADFLEKTPAAVTAMIRTGKLEEVRIKKHKFVRVSSLLDQQNKFERQVEEVTKYLVKLARRGIRSVYYEPIMAELGMSPSVPADRKKIGTILGTISHRTYKERKVLLSVLVHRKTAGTTRPGPGFFELAEILDFDWDDDDKLVEEQTNLVLKAYRTPDKK